MNAILLAVAAASILVSALRAWVNQLNLRHALAGGIPPEFQGVVDEAKFRAAQDYLAAQTRFGQASRLVSLTAGVAFLLAGGFGWVDRLAGSWAEAPIPRALLYFLVLGVLEQVIDLPFSWHHTFRLEERFGFNRSTLGTFVGDLLKGWALGIVLGGLLGAAVLWFLLSGGPLAWLWAWLAFTGLQLLLAFLAPVLLLPLFNKFEPLPEGELRGAIEAYARKVDFRLSGLFTMDGSKRSSKANAFFTGFGGFRRVVLFDTLVRQHSTKELVAVLAHEVGHFKLRHIPKQLALSIASSLLLFWLFSLILRSEPLALAFGFSAPSAQAALTIAFWLYAPFSLVSGLLASALSRRFEFEADAYASRTTGDPRSLAEALRRLSVESLSNLNPHPWKVTLDYSHPPVTLRMRALLGK